MDRSSQGNGAGLEHSGQHNPEADSADPTPGTAPSLTFQLQSAGAITSAKRASTRRRSGFRINSVLWFKVERSAWKQNTPPSRRTYLRDSRRKVRKRSPGIQQVSHASVHGECPTRSGDPGARPRKGRSSLWIPERSHANRHGPSS